MNTTATETLSRDDLLTDCERSMRYHQARARFFNTLHLFIQFIVFAIASASVSNLLNAVLADQSIVWAVVSMLALFSLVGNPARKHALHQSLYRGFTILNGTILATPDADDETQARWARDIHALYADEPPVYRALLAHCDNQIAILLGADKGFFVDLRWYHRLFRNWIPFQGAELINRNQAHQ